VDIRIDLSEVDSLARTLTGKAATVEQAAERIVAKGAYDMQATAQILVAVDTGNLKNSISTEVDGLSAEVGPTAEYGDYVENGTSTQAPQPYMGPAFDRHLPSVELAVARLGSGLNGR
jgi:HK97 gp10 family phage protein